MKWKPVQWTILKILLANGNVGFYPSLFLDQLISEAFAGGLEESGLRCR